MWRDDNVIVRNKFKKIFKFKYSKSFSKQAKMIINYWMLNNHKKRFFNFFEDIVTFINLNKDEKKFLLQILHTIAVFFQNNLNLNYFDIVIEKIEIIELKKNNRFLKAKCSKILYDSEIVIVVLGLRETF